MDKLVRDMWTKILETLADEDWTKDSKIVKSIEKEISKKNFLENGRMANYDVIMGQHDADTVSFYDYVLNVLGIKNIDEIKPLINLSASSGWVLALDGIAILSERHCVVERDDEKNLHCETGPAVAYPDGLSLYFWHGVRVPDHWIADRANLDPNEVIRHDNVEVRAAGAAIVGWPKMLEVLKAKVIDDSGDEDIGQLIEMTLPGLNTPGRFLKAVCPRNGVIVEGVPFVSDIDGKPIDTALAAQAWRVGDPQSEYEHPTQRT